jgi:enoyl-[acyl-carrier protein] reductase II
MGTRFLCTKESPAHPIIKERMLGSREDDTIVTGHITGLRCRVLKNRLTEQFLDLEDRKAPPREFDRAGIGKGKAAFVDGDLEWGSIWCGQVVGLVDDEPTCSELVERIVREAEASFRDLQSVFE